MLTPIKRILVSEYLNPRRVSMCGNIHTKYLIPLLQVSYRSHLPVRRNYSSALFITNDKLSQLCPSATPVVDIAHVLDSEKTVRDNLTKRKLSTSEYDFTQINDKYKEYLPVEETIKELKLRVINVEEFLAENKFKLDATKLEEKQIEWRQLKAEIKQFDDIILDYQKNVIIPVLKLPNDLDESTPLVYETVSEYKSESEHNCRTDNDRIAALDKYVKCRNQLDIHYLGEAAKFEYLFPIILKQYFSTKHHFVPFTNTDLCKGVIVEGCGTPYLSPEENIVLVNNETKPGEIGYDERRFHLVGGGSMEMFCAYHTNHSVNVKDLPVKSVASGKTYGFRNLVCDNVEDMSDLQRNVATLYNSLQKETVKLFVATDSKDNLNVQFKHLQNILESLLQAFNLSYRLCRTPAPSLHLSESSRTELQVFSDSLNAWVTCADICVNNDYVSKRLGMCYHKSVTTYERHYLHVLNATVYVNVLLVQLIETGTEVDVNLVRKGLGDLT